MIWIWLNIEGALFPKLSEEHLSYPEIAFQYAVHRLNLDKSLLPDTDLVHHIQYLSADSFQAVQKGTLLLDITVMNCSF